MKKEILDCACYSIDHAYIITFDKDFDNVKYEPDVIDDSDEQEKEKYGY